MGKYLVLSKFRPISHLNHVKFRSILHDQEVFPDPFEFRPERYLDKAGNLKTGKDEPSEAVVAAFGFGRRYVSLFSILGSLGLRICSICPGMYLAENSLFIAAATILFIFQISKATDPENGREIVPEIEYDGFIRYY